MKQVSILITLASIIFSCTDAQQDYVVIRGTIDVEKEVDSLRIFSREAGYQKVIKLDDQGTFQDTLVIQNNLNLCNMSLYGAKWSKPIFLKHNYDLKISIQQVDSMKYNHTITGKGAEINNYHKEKWELLLKYYKNKRKPMLDGDRESYLESVNIFKNHQMSLLDSSNINDKAFLEFETKNILYTALNDLVAFNRYRDNDAIPLDDNQANMLANFKGDNEYYYFNSASYSSLTLKCLVKKLASREKENQLSPKFVDSLLNSSKFKTHRDYLIRNNYRKLLHPNDERIEEYYNILMKHVVGEKIKNNIQTYYSLSESLSKGIPSPKFENYENYAGGTTSLDDFKGKYVYIDIWATWCGPCKREIPFLKEVEGKYHGKNIEFVSISIDKPKKYEAWKQMVVDEKLGGTQLIADKDYNSDFIKNYKIVGIPRFILIDPEGKIVNSDAPRPSDPKLVELFDSLLI